MGEALYGAALCFPNPKAALRVLKADDSME